MRFDLIRKQLKIFIYVLLMKQLHYINNQKTYLTIHMEVSEAQESQIYTPESNQHDEKGDSDQGYKRRIEKTTAQTIEGKWTEQQNLKYVLFMDYHSKIFLSKEKRKSSRIFKTLSQVLGSRTPRQCRSHFQKIMNKFKRLNNIRVHYTNQLGNEEYQHRYSLLVAELQSKLPKNQDSEKTQALTRCTVAVQTDPFTLSLNDLGNQEIMKLMQLLKDYQRTQLPFFLPEMNPLLLSPFLH